MECTITQQRG